LRPLRPIKLFSSSLICHRMVNMAALTARLIMRDGPWLLNR
jgi:hypothetical protein